MHIYIALPIPLTLHAIIHLHANDHTELMIGAMFTQNFNKFLLATPYSVQQRHTCSHAG